MLLFLSVFLSVSRLNAQEIDSVLSVYHDKFQQEKVYLHFDKIVYRNDETVWFKAYLFAGNELSDNSRNLYVDWFDDGGQLIKHTVLPVFASSAKGSFDVPVNYKGTFLHVKAYTQWMLNFDTSFLYHKNIFIDQPNTISKSLLEKPVTRVRFFPEGGEILNGINTNIAFIATNQWGDPVTVKGAIFNNNDELIDSFISIHDGMGKFSLMPVLGETYHCNWTDENGVSNYSALSSVKNSGATIAASWSGKKAMYVLSRTADVAENYKQMHLVATINQLEVYKVNINLNIRRTVASEIPVSGLPTGVLQITLFDANWIPVAERVLFVNNYEHEFFPELNVVTKGLTKRARNLLEINVADTSLLSNFSVAVTDAGLITDKSYNIFSQLLLSGDIKGYIPNAAYYFSSKEDSVREHLDLVMLTHGWRRFNWEDVTHNKYPVILYGHDSDYLQIKGKVFNGVQRNKDANPLITLILQQNGSAKTKQYLFLPLTSDGSFKQRGMIFFDTLKAFYQLSGDKRVTDFAAVSFQNVLPKIPYSHSFNVSANPGVRNYENADSIQLKWNKYFNEEYIRMKKLSESTTLKDVVVEGHIKSAKEVLNDKYTSGLFSDNNNAYPFDIMNDDRAKGSIDLFHYLQNMVPGLTMSLPILGANGANDPNSSNAPDLNWRGGKPDLFLDEMPTDALTLQRLQMTEVAYVKVFRPPFMGATGSGASGAIAVYTRKAGEDNTQIVKGLNSALLTGYTLSKEFFNPDYAVSPDNFRKDLRSTLYWNPYILTDKNTKSVRLEFFNNDISKKFRIILEGVNAAGKLARIEKVVE